MTNVVVIEVQQLHSNVMRLSYCSNKIPAEVYSFHYVLFIDWKICRQHERQMFLALGSAYLVVKLTRSEDAGVT
jgi:hypothetical protein